MQQILQNISSGKLSVANVPAPLAQKGRLLIANEFSLISAGTEKMIMDLAQKSLLGKARERPDQVRRVIEKVRNEGLLPTLRSVRSKLEEPMGMGYASAGIVLACGDGVEDFKPGDRVASNGPHAEVVSVPRNLCAKVPDQVTLEHASFTVLGAIALQGVRLANVTLGETVLVIGLGLVGQLTVSLLKAAGCRVIAVDPDASRCDIATTMGANIARPGIRAADIEALTAGVGADAVLITASTKSNGPIELAANAIRRKGRVVLVGVVGLELDRRPFYFKEAEFVVSCSYGPGRYDAQYEDHGRDYPIEHVRWTEQRNLQAVLDCMDAGTLDVSPLISHRFDIAESADAYEMIHAGAESFLGIVLKYSNRDPARTSPTTRLVSRGRPAHHGTKGIAVGVLGAGNFARNVSIPAIRSCDSITPKILCSAGGTTAFYTGEKHGFELATTDEAQIFDDDEVDAIFTVTQHNLHARHVVRAIEKGKHIFVEKPLCLSVEQLEEIETALRDRGEEAPMVMVGFNRRFSPAAQEVQRLFAGATEPLTATFRFNAGPIPDDHWTQDGETGGGRIIGEACHAIDTLTYLVGSPPVRVFAESIGGQSPPPVSDDQCFITLRHANGSISSVAYLAGGDKAFPKERIEVIGAGKVAVIDDFRTVTTVTNGKTRTVKRRQDKGHQSEVQAFADALTQGEPCPIPWNDIRSVTLASLLAVRSLREGGPLDLCE